MLNGTAPAWAHRRWRAMGSVAELVVHAVDAEALADRAVARVAELEMCWSRFDAISDLSILNRQAGVWCPVRPTLWTALVAAREAWHVTGGRFDPTVLGRLRELGYDRTFTAVPPSGPTPPAPSSGPTLADVDFDDDRRGVRLPRGVSLDLGGIGKGLAADLVADELATAAVAVSVSMGGDVAARGPGPSPDASWPVPVVGAGAGRLGEFPLVDEAIVQSTTALRRWRRGRLELHHVLDPATGWPADSGVVTAVVTGPRAALGEALAKAAIVAGPEAGIALVAAAGYDGWLFTAEGGCLSTPDVRDELGAAAGAG